MKNYLNYMEIGLRIRRQRELLEISREELAEHLDVSTKFVSDIELGVKGMSIHTLTKLSHVLKLTTDYILLGHKEKADVSPLFEAYSLCSQEKSDYAEKLMKLFLKAII